MLDHFDIQNEKRVVEIICTFLQVIETLVFEMQTCEWRWIKK